jgi:phospholipase/carboxylesterase
MADVRLITELAGLQCRVLQEGDAAAKACVVLCHGFGAPGDDLVGLYGELMESEPKLHGVRFVFPQAPLSLAALGYPPGSRAWWNIDWEQIQKLSVGDATAIREFRKREPEGMAAARAMMLKLVQELLAATSLPMNKLVLGGFSQGAMITTDVALRLEEPPAALVTMSGTLLIEDAWRPKAAARKGLPVFQSHGRQDPVLRFDAAQLLKQMYEEAGMGVDWHEFDGGHGIPLDVFRALGAFLVRTLG